MMSRKSLSLIEYYRLTWYGLLGTVSALVVASRVIPAGIMLGMSILSSLIVSLPPQRLAKQIRLLRLAIGLGLTLLFAYEVSRYKDLAHGIRIMIEMIVGALPLTLVTFQEKRSYWLSILNVTVIAIGGVALGSTVITFVAFLAFVCALVLSLNAANLYLSTREFARIEERNTLPRWYLLQVLQAMPAGFLTALIIFYAFPRAQTFSLGLSLQADTSLTGYSGVIDLKSHGTMERSSALALVVESPDTQWLRQGADDLLLRGNALHTFDGERWSPPLGPNRQLALDSGIPLATAVQDEKHILSIHLEPHSHLKLFYPEVLLRILERPSMLGPLLVGPDDALSRSYNELKRYSYTLKVSERKIFAQLPSIRIKDVTDHVPEELKPLLEIDPKIRQSGWFQTWTQALEQIPSEHVRGLTENIETYFARNFRATLEANHTGKSLLKNFLMVRKEGHCEYFATATTLYLRSRGIPARVVVGYRGGVFNKLLQALEVRDEHAHAWTELWLPDLGWYALDTTPMLVQEQGLTEPFTQAMNALQFWLRKYFVEYDQSTQKELLVALHSLAKGDTRADVWSWQSIATSLKNFLWPLLGVIAIAIGLGIWRRRAAPTDWPLYYKKFLQQMKRRGLQRDVGESLRAFHHRILESGKLSEQEARTLHQIDRTIELDLYASRPKS